MRKVPTIVRACVMLHNVCVDRWVLQHGPMRRRFPDKPPDHIYVDDASPGDDSVMERMHYNYVDVRRRSQNDTFKYTIMEDIFRAGLRMNNDMGFYNLKAPGVDVNSQGL